MSIESYVRLAASNLYPGQEVPAEMIRSVAGEIESRIHEIDWEGMWFYTLDCLVTYVYEHDLSDLRQVAQIDREEIYHKTLGEAHAIIAYILAQGNSEQLAHDILYTFQKYKDTQYARDGGNFFDDNRAWQDWIYVNYRYAKYIGLEHLCDRTMVQVAHYIVNNKFVPFDKTRA